MEKRRPHYELALIQQLVASPKTRLITTSAFDAAAALGLRVDQVVECVGSLSSSDFYKSMTTHFDHTLWQDVYHPGFAGFRLYVKVQLNPRGQAVIISFKELTTDD